MSWSTSSTAVPRLRCYGCTMQAAAYPRCQPGAGLVERIPTGPRHTPAQSKELALAGWSRLVSRRSASPRSTRGDMTLAVLSSRAERPQCDVFLDSEGRRLERLERPCQAASHACAASGRLLSIEQNRTISEAADSVDEARFAGSVRADESDDGTAGVRSDI